jgi:hypothetical protein
MGATTAILLGGTVLVTLMYGTYRLIRNHDEMFRILNAARSRIGFDPISKRWYIAWHVMVIMIFLALLILLLIHVISGRN